MNSPPWAYRLSISDIDAHYFEGAPDETFCSNCDSLDKIDYIPNRLNVHSGRIGDIGNTLDGRTVCRSRFREFCMLAAIDADFVAIPGDGDLFVFLPTKRIKFSPDVRPVRFIDSCKICGRFKEVIGSIPPYFDVDPNFSFTGILRSDLEFGAGRGKAPILIVDNATGRAMKGSRFRGLTLVGIDPFTTKSQVTAQGPQGPQVSPISRLRK